MVRATPRRRWAQLLVLVLTGVFLAVPGTAAHASGVNLCAEQVATALAVQARIKAHNARPHTFILPRQQLAYNAYNLEAQQLNAAQAQAKSRLNACLEAMRTLEDTRAGSPALTPPRAADLKDIKDAAARVPAGWRPPPPPARGKPWRVDRNSPVRPLYDVLRELSPPTFRNVPLRGDPRPGIGSRDLAYPASTGYTVGRNAGGLSAVSPDHIIPLAQIIHLPGFLRLSPQNMYQVVNARVNLQWLSYKSNWSKSSRSVAGMSSADPAWRTTQMQLEDDVVKVLQDTINKLLRSQA
ncbi:hypothetical protein [Micromonospora sp. KLBMP9576]|uniref:hypothetical protein n=1 Tax=Micromonospora sp. KLBMP9576 TaxID=3424769 RepID=UPI003D8F3986